MSQRRGHLLAMRLIALTGCRMEGCNVKNLKRVCPVAKIDDEMIVRYVHLDAAVEHAHHRHVFQPHQLVIRGLSPPAASVNGRDARRAMPGGGTQHRQQTAVVSGEVADIGEQHRPVDLFRRHVDTLPRRAVASQRRQQSAVVPRRVRITDCHDSRHVASTKTTAHAVAGQRLETVEVKLAEIRHETIQHSGLTVIRPTTVPASFAGKVVLRPVVISKHVNCTGVGRVAI